LGQRNRISTGIKGGFQTLLLYVIAALLSTCSGQPTGTPATCGGTAASLDYSTYVGGSAYEHIRDVVTDAAGNVYITGGTESADFPAAHRIVAGGATESGVDNFDIFVLKLDPKGSLVWSTRLGGPNYDRAYAIEIDPQGFIILAGRAGRGFPVTAGVFQTEFKGGREAAFYGNQDGVIIKLAPDGKQIVWASYFGTEDTRIIRDVAVDGNGDLLVASSRASGTYVPGVATAFRNSPVGAADGVVAKVAGDGSRVVWARYVGGSRDEFGEPSVRLDSSGNAYYLTRTTSTDARTTAGAYQSRNAGDTDMYLSKWDPAGDLLFATYIGGSLNENFETHNLALDASGNAYIAAGTRSLDFPTTSGVFQPRHGGNGGVGTGMGSNYGGDGFIAKISADGTRLLASTYFGGRYGDAIEGVAVDAQGNVHVTGGTFSPNLPVTSGGFQTEIKGEVNAFYAQFSSDLSTLRYASYFGAGRDVARTAAVDSSGSAYVAGEVSEAGFPVQNSIQSRYGGGGDAFLIKVTPQSGPCASITAVVNAASYRPGIVPGSAVSIFVSGVLSDISGAIWGDGGLSLLGTTVRVGGVPAPILGVANQSGTEQINIQAPFTPASDSTVNIEVERNGTTVPLGGVPAYPAQPGIFEWFAADGARHAAVVHADGRLVSPSEPARRDEIVSLFFTGGGLLTPSVATGALGPVPPATMAETPVVQVGGLDCRLTFAGYAPEALALYQVNFQINANAPSGAAVPVVIRIGDAASPASSMAIE
jgi:uncharacterized protein (TIGR03437 family)